ncbi:hypothetical protein V8C42DRAFT_319568 [Trichoderma barbatum]
MTILNLFLLFFSLSSSLLSLAEAKGKQTAPGLSVYIYRHCHGVKRRSRDAPRANWIERKEGEDTKSADIHSVAEGVQRRYGEGGWWQHLRGGFEMRDLHVMGWHSVCILVAFYSMGMLLVRQ